MSRNNLLNEDNLLMTLSECDKIANSNMAISLNGRKIFFMNDNYTESEWVANTTISDVESVLGDIDVLCALNGKGFKHRVIRFRKPRKKEFKNTLRFTPPKTYVVEEYVECANGVMKSNPTPVIQNENIVSQIDPTKGYVTDDTLNKAWSCLYCNKAYLTDKSLKPLPIEQGYSLSQACQEILDRLYTMENSFIVNYLVNNILFLIPVNYEDLKEALKNREKTDGRKPMLPKVIDEYIKEDGTIVNKYFRMSKDNLFTIGDKTISLTVGSDMLPIIFPKSNYGLNKAQKILRKEIDNE